MVVRARPWIFSRARFFEVGFFGARLRGVGLLYIRKSNIMQQDIEKPVLNCLHDKNSHRPLSQVRSCPGVKLMITWKNGTLDMDM